MNASILLAAGLSTRYGLANKLLQPVAGRVLIAHTLAALLQATNGPVVVVLGQRPRLLLRALAKEQLLSSRLRLCLNRHPDRGMGYSLALGLSALPRHASRVTIHLADMPMLDRHILIKLQRSVHHGAAVARPCHKAHPGHPVHLQRSVFELHELRVEHKPQAMIAALPSHKRRLIPGPAACLHDVDSRQMLRTLIWRQCHPRRPIR